MFATSPISPKRQLAPSSPIEAAYDKAAANLTSFKRLVDRRYLHAPHLHALDGALIEVSRYAESGGARGVGRLIIEMPPRHGKSLTVSRRFPAWFIGRNPDKRVMLVSYAANLAEKHARAARNLMATAHYQAVFRGVELARDSRAVDSFDVAGNTGGMDALGITGGATGKGAHLLLVDDPLKSRAEAESDVYRDRIWDAFTDDLYTRLEPGGAVVVVATRWHVDDLTGRLLKNMPGVWKRLKLPALAEDYDPLGRPIGAALWPERYPVETLRAIEQTLGPYSWAALYQQRPTPGEGGLFKLNYFEPARLDAPPLAQIVRYWDLAMSEKTSADYTVGLKLGITEDAHRFVLDVARKQIDWGDLTEYMAQVMIADGPSVAQGIEAKGYQSRAIQMLNADPRLHGYSIFGYEADKDKFTRALPAAAKAAAGYMHVLDRHWTPAFLDEVCAFPNAAHDDQVDALSGAENMLGDTGVLFAGSLAYGDSGQSASHY